MAKVELWGQDGWAGPLFGGLLRLLIAVGGDWVALHLTGSLAWVFAALAAGLVVYGVVLAVVIGSGAWFREVPEPEVIATAR